MFSTTTNSRILLSQNAQNQPNQNQPNLTKNNSNFSEVSTPSFSRSNSGDILSEGSSANCDKGKEISDCELSIRKSKPAYNYRFVDDRLKTKLFNKLCQVEGMDKSARLHGHFDISSEEYSSRVNFQDNMLYEAQYDIVNVTRDTWKDVVISSMSEAKPTLLLGCTGMGKTTRFPVFVAESQEGMVYVVQPTDQLAFHVAVQYVNFGHKVYYDADGTSSIPRGTNIVIGDGSSAIKRFLFTNNNGCEFKVIFFDEYHAATPAYIVLKNAMSRFVGVKMFLMTATLDSKYVALRKHENEVPGVNVQEFEFTSMSKWITATANLPFSPRTIKPGKWLFILPSHACILRFYTLYYKYVSTLYVSDKCSLNANQAAIDKFNAYDTHAPIVLLATPHFATGYNFDCDYVVDSGFVEEFILDPDYGVVSRYRQTTKLESVQRAGRLSRNGRKGTLYTWQSMSNIGHFTPIASVDTSIMDYYIDVYSALFSFSIYGRHHKYKCTPAKARMLISAKCISYMLYNVIGDSGAVHSSISGSPIFGSADVSVDTSLKPKLYDIHYDFEKESFIYHYSGMFMFPRVSQYSRVILSIVDFYKPLPLVQVHPTLNMEALHGAQLYNINGSLISSKSVNYKDNIDLKCVNSDVNADDVQVMDNVTKDDVNTNVCNSVQDQGSSEIRESSQSSVNNSDGLEYTVPMFLTPFESVMKNDRNVPRNDTIDVGHDVTSTVGSSDVSIPKGSSDACHIVSLKQGKMYYDYNSELLAVIRNRIPLTDDVYVPFMTIYQEPLGHRRMDSFVMPPMIKPFTFSTLKKEFLAIGNLYTPLLSANPDVNYMHMSDKDKLIVLGVMKDPSKVLSGTNLDRYRFFDKFLRVWNYHSTKFMTLLANEETMDTFVDKKTNRLSKILYGDPKTILEKDKEKCIIILTSMMTFYAKVLKTHSLFIIPYKSGNASGVDIGAWIEGINREIETPEISVSIMRDMGWTLIDDVAMSKQVSLKAAVKRLMVVSREEEGVIHRGVAMYDSAGIVYTTGHFLGLNPDGKKSIYVNGSHLNFSVAGKEFEATSYNGKVFRCIAEFAHRNFDLVKCRIKDADIESLGFKEMEFPEFDPTHNGDVVSIMMPVINHDTGGMEVYMSPYKCSRYDSNVMLGTIPLESKIGMSGAMVVSSRCDPIGLLTSVYQDVRTGKKKTVYTGMTYTLLTTPIFIRKFISKDVLQKCGIDYYD
uniref:Genome polyprotein n=1 Tax=Rhizopus microsporus virga-like virus 1 TaxID=3156536 RepID=A0AAT9H806_9VIRU